MLRNNTLCNHLGLVKLRSPVIRQLAREKDGDSKVNGVFPTVPMLKDEVPRGGE